MTNPQPGSAGAPNSEASGLTPQVSDAVMVCIHAYGDARADDDGTSGARIAETIEALRAWAGSLVAAHEAKRPSTSAEAVAYKFVNANSAAGWAVLVLDQVAWDKLGHGAKLYAHPAPSTDPKADPDLLRRMAWALEKARYHVIQASSVASPWGRESARLLASIDDQGGPPVSAHTCHWPGCGKPVPPAMWGCKTHWFRLPATLRARIWKTYKPGQEITKTPSPEYIAAAKAVQAWIKEQGATP